MAIDTSKPVSKLTYNGTELTLQAPAGTDRLQWKCDNTKSLQYEFYNCKTITDLSPVIDGLDTSNVTTMKNMFYECINLTSLDVSHFKTDNVTDMAYMFKGCYKVETLDLSNFNTENVTNMRNMFDGSYTSSTGVQTSGQSALKNIIFGTSFKTENVTNMSNMFAYISAIESLDLSGFNTSNVTNMSSMFAFCGKLAEIKGTIDAINATNIDAMFSRCAYLTTFALKNIKKSLTIGSGTSYGTLLDDPTIINTGKELWDLTETTSQKLTVATAVSSKLDTIYVKLITATDDMIAADPNITSKKPCEVCASTDDGAMTLREYIVSKNWTISG